MRVIVGRRGLERQAASTNTMSRFETEVLTRKHNPEGLAHMNARWVDRAMAHTSHRRVILDMDSSKSPVHGEQEGAALQWPLWLHVLSPDLCLQPVRGLRGGHATSWECPQRPQLAGGAGTPSWPATGGRECAGTLGPMPPSPSRRSTSTWRSGASSTLSGSPANEVLQWEIAPLLRRPVGRPPKKPIIWYDDFRYQAGSWDRPRRVIAKVEWHQGELFPRVGFIVTNMSAGPEGVVHFYNGRGTAEQWIKEGKYALNWTRLSCHRFVANQVRLALFILAYNTGELAAQAMPAQGGQALVVAKPPGQTYQDRGEASSPRPAAGVSASRGSGASGGISTSAGAYRRAPSSTRVASILGIIGGEGGSQGGAVRLDELKHVQTC